jgi:hypothetical protein
MQIGDGRKATKLGPSSPTSPKRNGRCRRFDSGNGYHYPDSCRHQRGSCYLYHPCVRELDPADAGSLPEDTTHKSLQIPTRQIGCIGSATIALRRATPRNGSARSTPTTAIHAHRLGIAKQHPFATPSHTSCALRLRLRRPFSSCLVRDGTACGIQREVPRTEVNVRLYKSVVLRVKCEMACSNCVRRFCIQVEDMVLAVVIGLYLLGVRPLHRDRRVGEWITRRGVHNTALDTAFEWRGRVY